MKYYVNESLDFKEVLYEKKDGVATITINRPHNYNAYSTPCLKELALAFEDASWDDSIAVVVFTGAGQKAFCTGGDVKEYAEDYLKSPHDYWKYMGLFSRYIESIMNCGKVVVARLNGMAVGGGNESHLACDLSIMGSHAFIGQVGSKVGSVACGGATQWLALFVGERRARQMLFLNEPIQPEKALEWGLVNEVAPTVRQGDKLLMTPTKKEIKLAQKGEEGFSIDMTALDEAVKNMCDKLKNSFPECTRYTKEQTNYWKRKAWYETIGHARDWLSIHYTSAEPFEGMQSFVEKRKPGHDRIRKELAEGRAAEFVWGPYLTNCGKCDAKGIPSDFEFCGVCGEKL